MKPKVNFGEGVDKSATIRRFVDLPKAFDLLTLDRLFMPTIATLRKGDPSECRIPVPVPEHIKRMRGKNLKDQALKLAERMLRKPMNSISVSPPSETERIKCLEEVKRWSDDALKDFVSAREAKDNSEYIVCNCWHTGSYESDAMWKIYAYQHGVVIVSTVERLSKALVGRYWPGKEPQKDRHDYTIALIQYTNPDKPEELERLPEKLKDFYGQHPWMLKRESFRHEQELRVFHKMREHVRLAGVEVSVNVQELIEKIVLNPFSPNSARFPVHVALDEILTARKLDIEIVPSKHMTSFYKEDALTRSLKRKCLPLMI
jgi:hypothetical protein